MADWFDSMLTICNVRHASTVQEMFWHFFNYGQNEVGQVRPSLIKYDIYQQFSK